MKKEYKDMTLEELKEELFNIAEELKDRNYEEEGREIQSISEYGLE